MQQLEAMLEHPFAELIIKTPSYEDAQHFYNERSYTAFTDAQHDAINDLGWSCPSGGSTYFTFCCLI